MIKENLIRQDRDPRTAAIIAAAIEVHRHLGPGLLESVYELGLCRELELRGIPFRCQSQSRSSTKAWI